MAPVPSNLQAPPGVSGCMPQAGAGARMEVVVQGTEQDP